MNPYRLVLLVASLLLLAVHGTELDRLTVKIERAPGESRETGLVQVAEPESICTRASPVLWRGYWFVGTGLGAIASAACLGGLSTTLASLCHGSTVIEQCYPKFYYIYGAAKLILQLATVGTASGLAVSIGSPPISWDWRRIDAVQYRVVPIVALIAIFFTCFGLAFHGSPDEIANVVWYDAVATSTVILELLLYAMLAIMYS